MTLKKQLIVLYNKSPVVKRVYRAVKHGLGLEKKYEFPPGHFYSPIVSLPDMRNRQAEIWAAVNNTSIPGVDLNTEAQLLLMKSLEAFYPDLPFQAEKQTSLRYYYNNPYYSATDAIVFHSMIRQFRPKRIIEIGSGFSSALVLDTNELFFDNQIALSFIEPYPKRLYSLMTENDKASVTVIEKIVQQTPVDTFSSLEAGDMLFVDSTHVAKTGSDLNYILFEILPALKRGVLIHFHDIFYPFEYPRDWVLWGRNWNEDYFLKAFLMYNRHFIIRLFTHYLHSHHHQVFNNMPLCAADGGGSIWIEKTMD